MTLHTRVEDGIITYLVGGAVVSGSLFLQGVVVLIETLFLLPWAIANGYVLSLIWQWYAVSIFHLPTLPVAAAVVAIMVIWLLPDKIERVKNELDETSAGKEIDQRTFYSYIGMYVVYNLSRPLTLLLCGWILRFFL